MTQLSLNRLPRRLSIQIMKQVAGGKEIPEEVASQIATKSDGVPLFVEELTQMVIRAGLIHEVDGRFELTGPLPELAIPSTLQDSLTARLDQLSPVRESVQLEAVLGREFSYELIRAVSPLDEVDLTQHLDQLVNNEFLYQRGALPETIYIFKHALIQDAAYNSLLISRRQQYHQDVAQVLEQQFPEAIETQPELIDHHYTEAGFNQEAVNYWQQAGKIAMQRSANVEAVNHLTRGLELLNTQQDSRERAQQELTLQIAMGTTLLATKGFAAPEVELVLNRARDLCQQVGETPQNFPVLFGLYSYFIARGESQAARELVDQLERQANRQQDSAPILMAHRGLMTMHWSSGELNHAREHMEKTIAIYEPQKHLSLWPSSMVRTPGSADYPSELSFCGSSAIQTRH